MTKTRAEAVALLHEYVKSDSLLKHALAVEGAMRWYAEKYALLPKEYELWGITGLLHDFDYEMYPESTPPAGHPYKGNTILGELGYPQELRTAIMGHAAYTGVARESQLAKVLFAVDELCGLVTAAVLVRPDRSIHNLETKSVIKKLKDKAFARGCNRDDIRNGAAELGVELDEHIGNVILALRKIAEPLGLAG